MTGPLNAPYERRFQDPAKWPSNRAGFADRAVRETYRNANELSWSLAGEQVAEQASAFLTAETARQERLRVARAEGWQAGEPGE